MLCYKLLLKKDFFFSKTAADILRGHNLFVANIVRFPRYITGFFSFFTFFINIILIIIPICLCWGEDTKFHFRDIYHMLTKIREFYLFKWNKNHQNIPILTMYILLVKLHLICPQNYAVVFSARNLVVNFFGAPRISHRRRFSTNT